MKYRYQTNKFSNLIFQKVKRTTEKIAAIQVVHSPDDGGYYGYAFRKDGTEIEDTTTGIHPTETKARMAAKELAIKAGYHKFYVMPYH